MKIILIDDAKTVTLEPATEMERQQMSKIMKLLKGIFADIASVQENKETTKSN